MSKASKRVFDVLDNQSGPYATAERVRGMVYKGVIKLKSAHSDRPHPDWHMEGSTDHARVGK